MKKLIYLFLTVSLATLFSMSSNAQAESKYLSWGELSDFQNAFAATYYPSQAGNFETIRSRADELSKIAMSLSGSVPKPFNSEEMTAAIKDLQKQTDAILASVKNNAKDEAINPHMKDLNTALEKVKSLCRTKLKEKGKDKG